MRKTFPLIELSLLMRLNERTASSGVRNNAYPLPRERNLTRLSVCPLFSSKFKGRLPKFLTIRERSEEVAPFEFADAGAREKHSAQATSAAARVSQPVKPVLIKPPKIVGNRKQFLQLLTIYHFRATM